MKKTFLALALLTSVCTLNAENNVLGIFNIGLKAGISSTSENIPKSGSELKEATFAEGTGWFGAAFVRVNVINKSVKVFLQPELQYTSNSYKIPTAGQIIGTEKKEEVEKVRLIDMPVLIGADFGLGSLVRIRANAGPVFAISQNKELKYLKGSDFESIYKNPSLSWTAGVGVSVLSLMLDLRYNGNFKGGKVDTSNVQDSIDTQRTSWNLALGIMF